MVENYPNAIKHKNNESVIWTFEIDMVSHPKFDQIDGDINRTPNPQVKIRMKLYKDTRLI